MKVPKNFSRIAEQIIKELSRYTIQTFKQGYPGYYYEAKEKHQRWFSNLEDKLEHFEDYRERQAVEYVIDKLRSGAPFLENDTYILEIFVRCVNKGIRINNFINNFSSERLKQESTTIVDLLNLIRSCTTFAQLQLRVTFKNKLQQHLQSLFSVVKHCENPALYPIQYKFWTNIAYQFFSVPKDYDSLCRYYQTFPQADRHREFGAFINGISVLFIDRLKEQIDIFSTHSAEYKKLTKIITLPELSRLVITMDPSLDYAKKLISDNLKAKAPRLDLGNCGITDLSLLDGLFKCTHLEELILSNEWSRFAEDGFTLEVSQNTGPLNALAHIPAKLSLLVNLKTLRIGGDWKNPSEEHWNRWNLKELNFVKGLTKLVHLNASNNQIGDISALRFLPYLKEIHLNNNKISDISALNTLGKLEKAFFSNNNISILPELAWIDSLKTIDLHSNQIKSLLEIRDLIENMDIVNSKWQSNAISIANNPLQLPSMEVVNRGKSNVIAVFDQLESEKEINLPPFKNKEVKLIVIGNSNAGKSSFIKWLAERKFIKDMETTHWLETKNWLADRTGEQYAVKIFDFGGQEYYHDTHHLFFSDQAAYLVLWEPKTNRLDHVNIDQKQHDGKIKKVSIQTFPLLYWLATIKYYTANKQLSQVENKIKDVFENKETSVNLPTTIGNPETATALARTADKALSHDNKPNVVIVQNKVDSQSDRAFLQQHELTREFPQIYDFQCISVHQNYRLNALEQTLEELLATLPILNSELPGTWEILRQHLETLPKALGNECAFEAFQTYCNTVLNKNLKAKGFSTAQVKKVLFDEQDTRTFAEYLNDVGLMLYFSQSPQLKDKVFVNPAHVIDMIYKVLLNLESQNGQFGTKHVYTSLGKPSYDQDCEDIINLMKHFKIIIGKPGSADRFVAPLYLPKDPDSGIALFIDALNKPVLRFFYSKYIHKTIFLEFFNEYGANALENTVGDNFYYWRNGIVLKDSISEEIVLVSFNNKIESGDGAYIDIHSLNANKGKEFLGRLIDSFEKISQGWEYEKLVTTDGINFIPLSIIKKNETTQSWTFTYRNQRYNLLDFKNYLSKDIKMKKVFISYSKSDSASLQKLENHLSVLRRTGAISTWNCRKLLPGDKWDGKIKNELEEADLIIFLVSDDFLATDYIWDIEIARAIERENADPNIRVVPIIVRSCDWQDSPLGIYNTAPKKAQVISTSNDIDEAWTLVIRELKQILLT